MQMPEPDTAILARKAEIVRRLQAVLPPDAVIHDPHEVARLRVRRLHRLSLPAAGSGAAGLDRGGRGGAENLP